MKTLSKYAAKIDMSMFDWVKNGDVSILDYLKHVGQFYNDSLRDRGYVFLRDIYERLNVPITKESIVVGWLHAKDNPIGDNKIIFDIYKRGENVWVDFNVDGNILDKFI